MYNLTASTPKQGYGSMQTEVASRRGGYDTTSSFISILKKSCGRLSRHNRHNIVKSEFFKEKLF